ncbi:MAG: ATP synthase F1 subunit epsilon [Gemmatimonadales bacterium]|nr:MAG: ATP synthase F1 subunit epsilon [Gemmatimonadales bacterium]
MASDVLSVRVVSPASVVFEGEASSLTAPAWDGQVGILPGHAPFIALLGGGMLAVDLPGGGSERYFVNRGVMKVEKNQVTVLSEYAAAAPPEGYDAGSGWIDLDQEQPDLDVVAGPENPLV